MIDTNAILAAATIVLVIITGYYAWQTHITVKEMKAARELSLMPVITCEMKCDLDRSLNEGRQRGSYVIGEFNDFLVENVGNAPATNVRIHLKLDNKDKSIVLIPSADWVIGTLGIGQKREVSNDIGNALTPYQATQPQVIINVDYDNVYRKHFKTTARFELISGAPTGRSMKPSCEWIKNGEEIKIMEGINE
jgi:hypothetical protein